MTALLDDLYRRRDPAAAPATWIALGLSALVHAAILSEWLPQVHLPSPDELKQRGVAPPLVVNLVRPHIVPPAPPAAPPRAAPRLKPSPAIEVPAPPRAPPVVALERPAPKAPRRTPPVVAVERPPAKAPPRTPPVVALERPAAKAPPPAAAPAPQREFEDLASYVEARRRARAAAEVAASPPRPASPPVEDENTRASRLVAQNLGLQGPMIFGYDPDYNGGVFNIELLSYDYAEFTFIGWNKDIRRVTKRRVEVSKGENSNIRIAVVRRMIALIREQVQEDFLWDSQRLGYQTLSARPKDNQALEDFLMKEFFGGAGGPPANPNR